MKLLSIFTCCVIAVSFKQPVHADTLYVTQLNSGEIIKVDAAGASSVFATGLVAPNGIAVDEAGSIFVVEAGRRLFKYAPDGSRTELPSVPASGTPLALAIDSSGRVHVSTSSGRVARLDPSGLWIPLSEANSEIPALSFSANGDLFASYLTENRIVRIQSRNGGLFVETNQPVGVACGPDGLVYATDTANNLIKRFTSTAVGSVFVNSGLINPRGLAVDRAGNVYAANAGGESIMKYSPSGTGGVFAAGFTGGPAYIAVDADPTPVAVSRKVHGTTPYDVNLPLTSVVGVECRTGGMNGDHSLVVTFLNPVGSVGGVSVTTGAGSVSGFTISGAQVFVSLEGVANAQRIGVTFSDVTFGARTLSFTVPMGVLVGDTTGSGTVNASDIGQTKAASGQTLGASNFRTDVTSSGFINATDVGLVKAFAGTMLPP